MWSDWDPLPYASATAIFHDDNNNPWFIHQIPRAPAPNEFCEYYIKKGDFIMHSDKDNTSEVIMHNLDLTCNTLCNYIFSKNV